MTSSITVRAAGMALVLALISGAVRGQTPQSGPGAASPATPISLTANAPFTVAVATAVMEAAPIFIAKEAASAPNLKP